MSQTTEDTQVEVTPQELLNKINESTEALQDAQMTVVDAVRNILVAIDRHDKDPEAHNGALAIAMQALINTGASVENIKVVVADSDYTVTSASPNPLLVYPTKEGVQIILPDAATAESFDIVNIGDYPIALVYPDGTLVSNGTVSPGDAYQVTPNPSNGSWSTLEKDYDNVVDSGATGAGGAGGGSATSSIPVISGPNYIPIKTSSNFTFTSTCGLVGGEIISFTVTFNGQSQEVPATDGAGMATVAVPAGTQDGAVFELKVVANDNFGGKSKTASKVVTARLVTVNTPTLTLPAASAYVSPASVTFKTTAFAADGGTDTHVASYYKISSDAAGEQVLYDSGRETSGLTSFTATLTNKLTPGQTYYAWAKHEGQTFGQSPWSQSVLIRAAKALTPSITAPAASGYVSPASVTITTSAFAAENSVSDTLAASYYKICTDQAGNSPVYESGRVSGTAVSHTASLSTKLTPGSTYYVFARHEGTNTGLSAWSSPVAVLAAKINTPSITSPTANSYQVANKIVMQSSAISAQGGVTDTLAATFWKICRDAAGADVVYDSGRVAGASTSHTASSLSLTPGSTYYCFVKHEGTNTGTSAWSSGVAVKVGQVNKPSITSPAAGALISPVSIALASSAFSTTGSDSHVSSDWKICSDANGSNVLWSANASSSKTNITATPASGKLTPKQTVYAFVRHNSANMGSSEWSAGVALTVSSVNAPSITAPTAGAEIMVTEGVTIVTGAFSTAGGIADTHASTDWKITSDAAGNTVVAQALGSADKLSHTFTGLDLTSGQTYYAWARHNGSVLGAGAWSAGRNFKALEATIAPSGRKFYRHSSGMGTVMEFNDGQPRQVVILDAKYRTSAKFGANGTDSSLTNYQSKNKNNTLYIHGGSAATTPDACKTLTDAFLNDMWAGSIDQNTAKANCDVWMTYEGTTDSQGTSGVPAVRAAREVKVNGVGCDIPNHQTLMRMYCDANIIDSLDPTVAAYPGNALGSANTNGAWKIAGTAGSVFTSTEYDSNIVRAVNYIGSSVHAYRTSVLAVAPVLEI